MNELSIHFSNGEINETYFNAVYSSYSKHLMGERSLLRVSEQPETVGRNANAQLIYDTGYNILLRRSVFPVIFSLIFAIILIPSIYGEDSKTGFCKVISSTRKGKGELFSKRLLITVFTSANFTALCCLSQFLRVGILFGWGGLSAPVQSLMQVADFPLDITVGGFFLILSIGCALAVAVVSVGILWVSKRISASAIC